MPEIKSPDLQVNKPIEAAAPDSLLTITIDPTKPLALGAYLFQLQVTDDSNNTSAPTQFRLLVVDADAPTAVIDGPTRVPFRNGFALSGKRSTDAGGGSLAKFVWTLIQAP